MSMNLMNTNNKFHNILYNNYRRLWWIILEYELQRNEKLVNLKLNFKKCKTIKNMNCKTRKTLFLLGNTNI